MDEHEQFILRLKRGTSMDTVLRYALDTKRTDASVLEHTGVAKGWLSWLPRVMKNFDNVNVVHVGETIRTSYMNPLPSTPTPVGVDVNVSMGHGDADDVVALPAPAGEVSSIRWPQMPPLCNEMENFRTPAWYHVMKAMVAAGKHIALSGPPGVGKDTAVIQLAAEEGHPLVTIGGDAGFRRRDLVGTAQISNGHSYFEVAEYAAAAINGWWVLLTEVNAADADALMYINAQMAAPYVVTLNGKAYPVHKDFRIFVSYNPGLIGTKPLPQSFKDRFFSIQVPFYTEPQLERLLKAHGLPDEAPWSGAIVKFGVNMWSAYERGQMRYQISTRRLIDAIVLMDTIVQDVREALKMAVLAAIDSPVEYKAAETVLRDTMNEYARTHGGV